MISFKLLTRILVTATSFGGCIIALSLYGSFPQDEDAVRPAISRNIPFKSAPAGDTAIRVAIYPGGAFAPGLTANGGMTTVKGSIFEKEQNLQIEFFLEEDPERCLALLGEEGGADLAWSTVPILTRRYCGHRGLNPVAMMFLGNSRGEDVVYVRHPAKGVEDLRGRSIACVRGGNSHHLLLFLLRSGGMDVKDLKWRFTSTDTDARILLQKGRVEMGAFSITGHTPPAGVTLFASSSGASKLLPIILLAREETVLTDRERMTRFITGWFRGLEEARKDIPGTIQRISMSFSSDMPRSEEMLKAVVLAGYRENRSFFRIGTDEPNSFDYLVDQHRSLSGETTVFLPPCEILKNTDLLVSLNEIMKKAPPGFDAGQPSSAIMTIETLSTPVLVKFMATDYAIDQEGGKALDRFSRLSLLFGGNRIILNGLVDAPENTAYTHAWGMRFYSITKYLTDLGIPKDSISTGGIRYERSLAGTGNHAVTCQLVK